jgi:hypothetical protein
MATPKVSSPHLQDVAAAAADSAWAVGDSGGNSLVLHWNGIDWSRETLPAMNPGNLLYSVAAVSDTEAWAVGSAPNGANDQTLVLHRVGGTWTRVPSANHNSDTNVLQAVTVVGPNDVWAAGRYSALGQTQVLTEHWNGSIWTEVEYHDVGTLDWSHALSAAGPDDVWFAGHATAGGSSGQIGHWDGASWSAEFAAFDVNGMAARTASDVWAVGERLGEVGARTWTRHFDGSDWTVAFGEDSASTPSWFNDVSNDDLTGTWAVGGTSGSRVPLIERWDGAAWRAVAAPKDVRGVQMTGVTSADGRLFAVGLTDEYPLVLSACPVRVTSEGFSAPSAVGGVGVDTAWVVPWGETGVHQLVDDSGFGLFDSGSLSEGESFSFAYAAAGTYPVLDVVTTAAGSIGVPVRAAPAKGPETTRFTITWSSRAPAAGTVYDVQVQRPDATRFRAWQSGTTSRSGSFLPDAGQGPYLFRSRVRDATGASSGWSPARRVRVT